MDNTDEFSSWVCRYGALYGPQIVLLATLSAITIYRREMSCNHCYANRPNPPVSRKNPHWNDVEAENLLDGVGLYCSGASIMPVVMHLLCLLKETELCDAPDSTEDILDQAGNFLSGEPLTSVFLGSHGHRKTGMEAAIQKKYSLKQGATEDDGHSLFAGHLPPDLQIHVCSFLHPRDVIAFGSVNQACRATVENHQPSSSALWKTLFLRDYSWTVRNWDIGMQALARSAINFGDIIYTKEFYFKFGLAFVDYVLAGQNTVDRCLVGLKGQIYDMTPFILAHPGSPETVLVSAGKDATQFFKNVRHSNGALRLAKSFCVVVDDSKKGGVGFRPTSHTSLQQTRGGNDVQDHIPSLAQPDIIDNNEVIHPQTLFKVRQAFSEERLRAQQLVREQRHTPRLTDINVFYDPFQSSWKAWYTNDTMEAVFLNEL